MTSQRQLIINADDYGHSSEVNLAIEQLARANRIGGVSVLANGKAFEDAAAFLRSNPRLSAGVHLNVVEGKPLRQAGNAAIIETQGNLATLAEIVRRWVLRPREVSRAVELEWRCQIERLLTHGVSLSHADSHQHLHAFPPAFNIAARLCREYSIGSLRWPRERSAIPLRRSSSLLLSGSLALARAASREHHGLVHNDHFLGFRRAGGYGMPELLADFRELRRGLTELAIHPSVSDRAPYPSLNGDLERRTMLDVALPAAIDRLGITLMSWSEAGSMTAGSLQHSAAES